MSHHFDSILAKEDPRLNVADMYLFEGSRDSTVFVLTTNADVGLSAPDTLHEEGIYSFRVHTSDALEDELSFKFRFGSPVHAGTDEHVHKQPYQLIYSKTGQGIELHGHVVLEGETGKFVEKRGFKSYVGIVPELWAADAAAFQAFMKNLWVDERYDASVWSNPQNFFLKRNIMAIVLEVPNSVFQKDHIKVWSNITLFGHATEMQVSRWGVPLFSHLFLSEPNTDWVEKYHKHHPTEDVTLFAPAIEKFIARAARLAGATVNPHEYASQLSRRLCPTTLPYKLRSKARFSTQWFNGRPLTDDVLDVMFSLATNIPIADGVAPDFRRVSSTFPYYGAPFSKSEQEGLTAYRNIRTVVIELIVHNSRASARLQSTKKEIY